MARARYLRLAKKDRSVYEVVVRARGASHIKKRPSLIGNTDVILRLRGLQMQARGMFFGLSDETILRRHGSEYVQSAGGITSLTGVIFLVGSEEGKGRGRIRTDE